MPEVNAVAQPLPAILTWSEILVQDFLSILQSGSVVPDGLRSLSFLFSSTLPDCGLSLPDRKEALLISEFRIQCVRNLKVGIVHTPCAQFETGKLARRSRVGWTRSMTRYCAIWTNLLGTKLAWPSQPRVSNAQSSLFSTWKCFRQRRRASDPISTTLSTSHLSPLPTGPFSGEERGQCGYSGGSKSNLSFFCKVDMNVAVLASSCLGEIP